MPTEHAQAARFERFEPALFSAPSCLFLLLLPGCLLLCPLLPNAAVNEVSVSPPRLAIRISASSNSNAVRVSPAVARLTVYRWLQVEPQILETERIRCDWTGSSQIPSAMCMQKQSLWNQWLFFRKRTGRSKMNNDCLTFPKTWRIIIYIPQWI